MGSITIMENGKLLKCFAYYGSYHLWHSRMAFFILKKLDTFFSMSMFARLDMGVRTPTCIIDVLGVRIWGWGGEG